ncbi:hypothetical protein [Streptomyces sp. LUP47B]|uniref:hypothetical protein n=1 Tax=Streptomyces sp. LUP47B TaxID=1890286 RepID=UPI0008515E34|nr:hypothetical protein [Streptomyces sp. LUP47B]
MDGATGADTGVAISMNNASLQIGSAIGLAAPVSVGTSHATSLWHAGIDATTAIAARYVLSFAVAAGVRAFGAGSGSSASTRPTAATIRTVRKTSRQRAA